MPTFQNWPSVIDDLQSRGRYTFTSQELEELAGVTEVSLRSALRRLKRGGRIVSPRRGFYVIVPVEYRVAGAPPPSWYIDDFMAYLGQPYYVGLLSAAATHGAAHQQPMVFQVVTDRPTRPTRAGRGRIEFHTRQRVEAIPTADLRTETGTMKVSTPEATAFDVVYFVESAGYLGNVATILAELAEEIDGAVLPSVAELYPLPVSQRLGYLLDRVSERERTTELGSWLASRRARPIPLAPWRPLEGFPRDQRWRVIENEDFEVEV